MQSEKLQVYVAGRFTAPTIQETLANIYAAEAVAAEVIRRSEAFALLVPHSLGRNFAFTDIGSAQYWYEATEAFLHRSDVLLTVPGWETSKGTKAEIAWSLNNGIPVVHSPDRLLLLHAEGLIKCRTSLLFPPLP